MSLQYTCGRGTIITGRADAEPSKISDVPGRNSKTSNFQNRRTEFRKVDFNKKEYIEAIPSHT
jgi:hypothetical protein